MYAVFNQYKNVTANTSTITSTLYTTGGTATWYYTGPTNVWIDNTLIYTHARTNSGFPATTGSSTMSSVTMNHNQDGTLSVVPWIRTAIYDGQTSDKYATWTLSKIDRNATIDAVPSFNVEDGFSCRYTTHVDTYTQTITLSLNGETIKTASNYVSGTVVPLSDSEILHAYDLMGEQRVMNFTVTLTSYSGATAIGSSSMDALGTCVGTFRLNNNGIWVRALPWVNDGGTWKKALAYANDNGTWKRGE